MKIETISKTTMSISLLPCSKFTTIWHTPFAKDLGSCLQQHSDSMPRCWWGAGKGVRIIFFFNFSLSPPQFSNRKAKKQMF